MAWKGGRISALYTHKLLQETTLAFFIKGQRKVIDMFDNKI